MSSGGNTISNQRSHCDGNRRRRFSPNEARKSWYARHRSVRFVKRFGLERSYQHQASATS